MLCVFMLFIGSQCLQKARDKGAMRIIRLYILPVSVVHGLVKHRARKSEVQMKPIFLRHISSQDGHFEGAESSL